MKILLDENLSPTLVQKLGTLQQLLGHHDVKVTMKYAHLAPHFMASEAARVNFAPRPAAPSSPPALPTPTLTSSPTRGTFLS